MKSFLLSALKFIFGILLIYLILSFIFINSKQRVQNFPVINPTNSQGYTKKRLAEAENYGQVDYLFIGSSHVYTGFDIQLFEKNGIRAFNLGSPSQTPAQSYILLKYYSELLKPKEVHIDVYWSMLSRKGVEPAMDICSNAKVTKDLIFHALEQNEPIVYTALLGNIFSSIIKKLPELPPSKANGTYISGGYSQPDKSMNDFKYLNEKIRKFKLSEYQINYLKKIKYYADLKGIRLVFIKTPVTKWYIENTNIYEDWVQKMKQVSKELDVKFVNFNEEKGLKKMKLNDTLDFCDKSHLTYIGVRKFNNYYMEHFQL